VGARLTESSALRVVLPLIVVSTVVSGRAYRARTDVPAPVRAGYRQESVLCVQQSQRKQQVAFPAGGAVTTVDMPGYYDARDFGECMRRAGYGVPRADPQQYLEVARTCLGDAAQAGDPDAAYADCVRRSRITVEVLPGGE
jgi:hypothetical protein